MIEYLEKCHIYTFATFWYGCIIQLMKMFNRFIWIMSPNYMYASFYRDLYLIFGTRSHGLIFVFIQWIIFVFIQWLILWWIRSIRIQWWVEYTAGVMVDWFVQLPLECRSPLLAPLPNNWNWFKSLGSGFLYLIFEIVCYIYWICKIFRIENKALPS